MIENPKSGQIYDRLFAFLRAFPLMAQPCESVSEANLMILAEQEAADPTHILYRPRPQAGAVVMQPLAMFALRFGGSANPLIGALPDEIAFPLSESPHLSMLSELILAEQSISRCGGGFVRTRLSEAIVVYAIRSALKTGTVNAGLLAGLAHPTLHGCLVALHDDPARGWRLADLAALADMRRSQFIRTFTQTVGQPPLSYLTAWRLTLARVYLAEGDSVKRAGGKVGFGSAAAFSRAFTRRFGYPPSQV